MRWLLVSLLLVGGAWTSHDVQGQARTPFQLSSAWVEEEGGVLPTVWLFKAGDDEAYALPEETTSWEEQDTRLLVAAPLPQDWEGIGWFRLPVLVDSSVVGVSLGLQVQQYGAFELYLDGERIHVLGTPHLQAEEERPLANPRPVSIVFHEAGRHVLAVRYSNHAASSLRAVGYDAGFSIQIGYADTLYEAHAQAVRGATLIQFGLTGIYAVFGLLHLFFFAFYPQRRENLYFALVAFCISIILFNNFHEALFFGSAGEIIFIRRLWAPLTLFTVLVFLRLIYAVYERPIPKHYYGLLGVGIVLGLWGWLNPNLGWWNPAGGRTYTYVFALVIEAEMLRVVYAHTIGQRRLPDFFAFGVVALILAFSYPLLVVLGFLYPFIDLLIFPNIVITGWLLSTSLYLSRGFAKTNLTLQKKLEEVTQLSEEKLAQERLLRQQEVERKLLEAEYEQKLRELEEARQLQLSMLPEQVPLHPEVELAAYMQTATEVGGDYYDFSTEENGPLTLAIGDATGHGMRAGTMVTATKSLFNLLGQEENLLGIFDRATRALKRFNMRKLYMALTLARYDQGRLRLATAGMPPTLIYRAASEGVETVQLKGMPLGSFVNFPYQDEEIVLDPGDTVLFMSDGFPELFNEDGEMLGYEQASRVFADVAHQAPHEIIDHLVATSQKWRSARQQDDDMTFVVLKVRPHS